MKRIAFLLVMIFTVSTITMSYQVVEDWSPVYNSCSGMKVFCNRGDVYAYYTVPTSTSEYAVVAVTDNYASDCDLYVYDNREKLITSDTANGDSAVAWNATSGVTYIVAAEMYSGQGNIVILDGRVADVTYVLENL